MDAAAIAALALAIKQDSAKYRWLALPTLERVVAWAARRSKSIRETEERAHRKLHQIYGAYFAGWQAGDIEKALTELARNPAALRETARSMLSAHASGRERLAVMDRWYPALWEITGPPRRIFDAGCGLHPFALPWLGLATDIEYVAWDIDERMNGWLNRFFAAAGYPQARAECRDILLEMPPQHFDVAFCMKLLPCLEQQEAGCSRRLRMEIPADFLVVTFPVRSLGGRAKGMRGHYAEQYADVLAAAGSVQSLDAADELVYVIDRRGHGV